MAVVAGNWKMHMGPSETSEFFRELGVGEVGPDVELILFPPAISLAAAAQDPGRDPRISIGVQNIHWEDQGAFTGETSGRMAESAGATYALVGHSERRHIFGETDDQVAQKVEAALRNHLVPVLCVGETLSERREGLVDDVILRQLQAALNVLRAQVGRFLVAYEPVWAIGTGETATPKDASEAHSTLREALRVAVGAQRAHEVPLLYGGSVKPDNAAELLAAPDVDGVLVGGASLDPVSFSRIAAAAG